MGILARLLGKTRKVILDDPVFGSIEFSPAHGIEMWCHIPSDPACPMIVIQGPLSGPTPAQRDFYEGLRGRLTSLAAECRGFINRGDHPPAGLSEMTVYAVELGPEAELKTGRFVIELSNADADEIHRVEFMNGQPSAYGVDH